MPAESQEELIRRIVREEAAKSDLLTETEAASFMKVSGATIRSWATKKLINKYGRARSTRYSRRELMDLKPEPAKKSVQERAAEAARRLE